MCDLLDLCLLIPRGTKGCARMCMCTKNVNHLWKLILMPSSSLTESLTPVITNLKQWMHKLFAHSRCIFLTGHPLPMSSWIIFVERFSPIKCSQELAGVEVTCIQNSTVPSVRSPLPTFSYVLYEQQTTGSMGQSIKWRKTKEDCQMQVTELIKNSIQFLNIFVVVVVAYLS